MSLREAWKYGLYLAVVAALILAATSISGSALAAKGGNGHRGASNGSSITLDQTDPQFGDQVTFTISASFDNPWVRARCYVSGALVYEQWHGMYEGYRFEPVFTLGPTPSWPGGGANCVADLIERSNNKTTVRASTSFDVSP